jgi:hypothetical protein
MKNPEQSGFFSYEVTMIPWHKGNSFVNSLPEASVSIEAYF